MNFRKNRSFRAGIGASRRERYLDLEFELTWFVEQLISNPVLLVTTLLTLGVIFVNGWTDAPNAIATCVATRAMPPRAAVLMSAAFNFLGVFVMTLINSTVAMT